MKSGTTTLWGESRQLSRNMSPQHCEGGGQEPWTPHATFGDDEDRVGLHRTTSVSGWSDDKCPSSTPYLVTMTMTLTHSLKMDPTCARHLALLA